MHKHIEGDRMAGVSLHICRVPSTHSLLYSSFYPTNPILQFQAVLLLSSLSSASITTESSNLAINGFFCQRNVLAYAACQTTIPTVSSTNRLHTHTHTSRRQLLL